MCEKMKNLSTGLQNRGHIVVSLSKHRGQASWSSIVGVVAVYFRRSRTKRGTSDSGGGDSARGRLDGRTGAMARRNARSAWPWRAGFGVQTDGQDGRAAARRPVLVPVGAFAVAVGFDASCTIFSHLRQQPARHSSASLFKTVPIP